VCSASNLEQPIRAVQLVRISSLGVSQSRDRWIMRWQLEHSRARSFASRAAERSSLVRTSRRDPLQPRCRPDSGVGVLRRETVRGYIRQRGAAWGASELANWDRYNSTADLAFKPAIAHEVVDNSDAPAPLQQQAAAWLSWVTRP
jgi:hypothetical protein